MPSEPMPIPKAKAKAKAKKQIITRNWICEKNKGCMWSCPCDCNNCVEFNKLILYKD